MSARWGTTSRSSPACGALPTEVLPAIFSALGLMQTKLQDGLAETGEEPECLDPTMCRKVNCRYWNPNLHSQWMRNKHLLYSIYSTILSFITQFVILNTPPSSLLKKSLINIYCLGNVKEIFKNLPNLYKILQT